MKSADEIRERLDKADREVLKARHELNEHGAYHLAGECSAISNILCELMRPDVIEECDSGAVGHPTAPRQSVGEACLPRKWKSRLTRCLWLLVGVGVFIITYALIQLLK